MGSEICFGNNLVLDYRKLSIDIIYLYYICFIVHQLLPIFLSYLIIKLESNTKKNKISLPLQRHSLPSYQDPTQSGTFVTTDETTVTSHYHLKSIV